MMAYLAMMTPRLLALHRVLKPTGSLYLHCDPTASHYLKIVLDTIFGPENFKNEIIWRRYGIHNDVGQGSRHFGRVHDTLLFYTRSIAAVWNQVFTPLSEEYVQTQYRTVEPETGRRFMTTPLTGPGGEAKGNPVFEWKGHTRAWRYNQATMERLEAEGRLYYSKTGYVRQKKYLDESKGVPVQDQWNDIPSLQGVNVERLGYPTQKPVALLKRIIAASSNPGDMVLDPFCGCGTAIDAAQELGRRWLGIDVTHLAVNLIKVRLANRYALKARTDYRVVGEPEDLGGAHDLALNDREGFEYWALSLVDARPWEGAQKKGADKGRDGLIVFTDDETRKTRRAVVSVKSGKNISVVDIRDLRGTMEREKAELGVFLTLSPPTKPMIEEAAEAGAYTAGHYKPVRRLQLLTVAELLEGKAADIPGGRHNIGTFQRAARAKPGDVQPSLLDE